MSTGNRTSRSRRAIEKLLLVIGLLGVGAWAGSIGAKAVFQSWENYVFEQNRHGNSGSIPDYLSHEEKQLTAKLSEWWGGQHGKTPVLPSPSPQPVQPPVGPDGLVGRLSIPRLHLSAMVREGTGATTLDLSLGHIPGTAFPGQKGNVAVAGHRDTLFRGLRLIGKNDLIDFQTLHGDYAYQVESIQIVKPDAVSVLRANDYPQLTLVTCYPFYYVGSAPERFIVKARQIVQSQPPPVRQVAANVTPTPPQEVSKPAEASPKPRPVKPAPAPIQMARRSTPPPISREDNRRVAFAVSEGHSRQLAPGISFGVSFADTISRRVDGWVWFMPDRRTIWLRDHPIYEPVVFYGFQDGMKRELVITSVGRSDVGGYILLPPGSQAEARVAPESRSRRLWAPVRKAYSLLPWRRSGG